MRHRRIRKRATVTGLLAAIVIVVFSLIQAHRQPQEALPKQTPLLSELETYTVNSVVDGDSLRLTDGTEVRLIGIDAPDKKHNMFYSDEAREFTERLLEGRQVKLRFDKEKRDNYGRILAYVVYTDGNVEKVANVEIVRAGCAYVWSIKPNTMYEKDIMAAQKEARENGLGVWRNKVKIEKEYIIDWGKSFGVTHRPNCKNIGKGGRLQKVRTREEGFDLGAPPCRTCQP